jgi:transcriptional regulator with XRE-family HTH domain
LFPDAPASDEEQARMARSTVTTHRKNDVPAPAGTAPASEGAPHPTDLHVGRRLRFRRGLLGISQSQLAEKVGLTFQAIQKYERGENRISASRLYQFAEILGVPVSDFFDGLPRPEKKSAAERISVIDSHLGLSDRETHEILRAFGAITHTGLRKSLLRLLQDSAAVSETGGGQPLPRDEAVPLADGGAPRPATRKGGRAKR